MNGGYQSLMNRYRLLLREYESMPRGEAHRDLDDALTKAEEALIINPPPGKGKGLVEGGPTLDCPTLTEAVGIGAIIPVEEWVQKINEADSPRVRPFSWTALNQGSRGSCAGEGVTGAVLALRDKKKYKAHRHRLNGYFPYHWSSGGVDRGSTLSANLKLLTEKGVCTEEVWPRTHGPFSKPPEAAMKNALRHKVLEYARVTSKVEWGTTLLKGYPVYGGYSGHAWYATDGIDTSRFRWKNSWGTSWGDEGFGTLAYSSVMWQYGAYAILSVTSPDDEV